MSAEIVKTVAQQIAALRDPSGEMILAGQAAITDMGKVLTGAEIGAVWRAMWEANQT